MGRETCMRRELGDHHGGPPYALRVAAPHSETSWGIVMSKLRIKKTIYSFAATLRVDAFDTADQATQSRHSVGTFLSFNPNGLSDCDLMSRCWAAGSSNLRQLP